MPVLPSISNWACIIIWEKSDGRKQGKVREEKERFYEHLWGEGVVHAAGRIVAFVRSIHEVFQVPSTRDSETRLEKNAQVGCRS